MDIKSLINWHELKKIFNVYHVITNIVIKYSIKPF